MGCGLPTLPLGVQLHTWAATASHGTSIGLKGAIHAAKVLAGIGLDMMTDPALRSAARADLERRTQGQTYRSPLPDELRRPLGTPEHLLAGDTVTR
jgi:aminobenzoyl-glutamate utilization protein B